MDANQLITFGDARRMILQTIADLRNGNIEVNKAMAIAANMKVLNDSVQVEINAAKLAMITEGKANNFGRVVGMGQKLLGNDINQPAS
jgi:hypothetical protein